MEEKKADGGHGGGEKKKGLNWGLPAFILFMFVMVAVALSFFGETVWGSRMAIEGSFNVIVKIMMSFLPIVGIALLVATVVVAIMKWKAK